MIKLSSIQGRRLDMRRALQPMQPELGEAIRRWRRAANLTQQQLSQQLTKYGHDYAASTVGSWETGSGNPPILDKRFVEALALSLDISTIDIYEAAGILEPSTNIEAYKLVKILETATPAELENIKQYAKFVISNRKNES